jgi:hypothetical protein
MKEELKRAETLLADSGLKTVAKFCGRLADGKPKCYFVANATPDYGYLQWNSGGPSPQDYEPATEYPGFYLDKKEVDALAMKATIVFLRSMRLDFYWEGMCYQATSNKGFESVEALLESISNVIGKPFLGTEEFLALDDTSDEQLVEIIEMTGYYYFRAEAIKLSP